MSQVVDYRIHIAHMANLANEVKALIDKGWQPLGGPFHIAGADLQQAMVKYATNRPLAVGDHRVCEKCGKVATSSHTDASGVHYACSLHWPEIADLAL